MSVENWLELIPCRYLRANPVPQWPLQAPVQNNTTTSLAYSTQVPVQLTGYTSLFHSGVSALVAGAIAAGTVIWGVFWIIVILPLTFALWRSFIEAVKSLIVTEHQMAI